MTSSTLQHIFEREMKNYKKLEGVTGVPLMRAVVRKSQNIQGFLISYIEGCDLREAAGNKGFKDVSQFLDITARIIQVAVTLEARDFYHEDQYMTIKHASVEDVGFMYSVDIFENMK